MRVLSLCGLLLGFAATRTFALDLGTDASGLRQQGHLRAEEDMDVEASYKCCRCSHRTLSAMQSGTTESESCGVDAIKRKTFLGLFASKGSSRCSDACAAVGATYAGSKLAGRCSDHSGRFRWPHKACTMRRQSQIFQHQCCHCTVPRSGSSIIDECHVERTGDTETCAQLCGGFSGTVSTLDPYFEGSCVVASSKVSRSWTRSRCR